MQIDLKEHNIMIMLLLAFLFAVALMLSLEVFRPVTAWWVMTGLSAGWFLLEYNLHREVSPSRVLLAAHAGVFLMLICFIFCELGAFLGLWSAGYSLFQVFSVPVELLLIALFFGAAHSIYLPRRFEPIFSVIDILLFTFFGAAWEALLMKNGMLTYHLWWTPIYAALSYGCAWITFHFAKYTFLTPK